MKILAVDDDPVCLLALQAMATSLGHECQVAANGREAWRALQRGGIEVLISDRTMPDMDGLQLCHLIRNELAATYVYVIMATGLDQPDQVKEGMLAGADDYLTKPVKLEDLRLRLIAAERISSLHRHLEVLNMELRTVARLDPLTGLGDRRALQSDLETLSAQVTRYDHRYSLAMVDLDSLADYNSRYGKPAGDRALKAVAACLNHNSRAGDTCYRYSGGAFLCIYAQQTPDSARVGVERFVAALASLRIAHDGSPFGELLTVSVGIAEMCQDRPDPAEAIRLADSAMHHAKSVGRNAIELAPEWVKAPAC